MGITYLELNILDEFQDVEYERSIGEVSLLVSVINIILICNQDYLLRDTYLITYTCLIDGSA